MQLVSPSAGTTFAIGRAAAAVMQAGDVVVLTGDLGAGKTVLAKGIAAGLGVTEPVVSPTFALVREYAGRLPIHHLDVYRLDRVQEAIDLGLDELLDDGVVIVEWGEGVRELLPGDRLEITLAFDDADEERRHVTLDAIGPTWAVRLGELQDAVRRAVAEASSC
ncbi:MAG: tRNA (adenosine(37)-N6)-threonylcarbamoyltransferase complex ATPase subunit type 1 TsaE [Acidimicrobiia bacterium]